MNFRYFYRSTDTGAPVLNGTSGSLINVFSALVDGYNAQAVQSITRVGQIATVQFAAPHNFNSDGLSIIHLSGSNEAEYNGDFRPFNITSQTLDITVTGTPATPATGTITAKVAGAGWLKPFTGTSKAAFLSNNPTLTQLFLRIDDNNPDTNGYLSSRLCGYETISGIDTYSVPFPTTAQQASGLFLAKTDTTGSSSRQWMIVTDDRFFYFLHKATSGSDTGWRIGFFGNPDKLLNVDSFGCLIKFATSNTITLPNSLLIRSSYTSDTNTWAARGHTQTGTAVRVGLMRESLSSDLSDNYPAGYSPNFTYPQYDNNLLVSNIIVTTLSSAFPIRSHLPFVKCPMHQRPLTDLSIVNSNGEIYLAVNIMNENTAFQTSNGQLLFNLGG